MNFRRRKKPSVNYINPYSVLKLWQYFFFFFYYFWSERSFQQCGFLLFHTMSQITFIWHQCGYVWTNSSNGLLSQHWKNNDNNNKNPLKCLPLPFSMCFQLSSYSRYNPVTISESMCTQIKVVYEKSLMHLLGSQLQFHKASLLLKMLNCIFTHLMQGEVVF